MILRKTLHCILRDCIKCFSKLDSRTVEIEKQNEQLSAIAIKYSSELKFAYGRVMVSVRY